MTTIEKKAEMRIIDERFQPEFDNREIDYRTTSIVYYTTMWTIPYGEQAYYLWFGKIVDPAEEDGEANYVIHATHNGLHTAIADNLEDAIKRLNEVYQRIQFRTYAEQHLENDIELLKSLAKE